MIKRFVLGILIMTLVILLCGCRFTSSIDIMSKDSPHITTIDVGERYFLDHNRPYDMSYNDDDTLDVIIHFILSEEDVS